MNKIWFVTGAARGIGAGIVKALLRNGEQVVAAARDVSHLPFEAGPRLLPVTVDVTDPGSIERAVKCACDCFGAIDVLVNNAGFGMIGAIEESQAEEVKTVFEINVFGMLNVIRTVLPVMRKQRSGHVFNISSMGGFIAGPGWGIYCAAKFAVEGLSEALAGELASLGIKVTVVEPGYFRSDFFDARSMLRASRVIADYQDIVGAAIKNADEHNHLQKGDPIRLGEALICAAASPNPPLRLPLGEEAVQAIRYKIDFVRNELVKWEELSHSTDFA